MVSSRGCHRCGPLPLSTQWRLPCHTEAPDHKALGLPLCLPRGMKGPWDELFGAFVTKSQGQGRRQAWLIAKHLLKEDSVNVRVARLTKVGKGCNGGAGDW